MAKRIYFMDMFKQLARLQAYLRNAYTVLRDATDQMSLWDIVFSITRIQVKLSYFPGFVSRSYCSLDAKKVTKEMSEANS